jgi:type I restriction enzyme R subunit
MRKKDLSETDICTQYITPAVVDAGWDLKSQVRQEVYFTNERIIILHMVNSIGDICGGRME